MGANKEKKKNKKKRRQLLISMEDSFVIGQNEKRIRESRKMKQEDFANALGLENYSISKYENGNRRITLYSLLIAAKIYDVSLDELIAGISLERKHNDEKPDLVDDLLILSNKMNAKTKRNWLKMGEMLLENSSDDME